MTIELLDAAPVTTSPISTTQIVQFDVRSTVLFRRVIASIEFVGLQFRETAYEGDPAVDGNAGFTDLYSARSTIEEVNDAGWERYQLRLARSPAWPASPTLHAIAYNTSGEEI